jgi:hypothetical protein
VGLAQHDHARPPIIQARQSARRSAHLA